MRQASVRHQHGHLNLLNIAHAALVVRAAHHRHFLVHAFRHRADVVSVVRVLLRGHARDEGFTKCHDLIIVLGLTSLKPVPVLLVYIRYISELFPSSDEALRKRD